MTSETTSRVYVIIYVVVIVIAIIKTMTWADATASLPKGTSSSSGGVRKDLHLVGLFPFTGRWSGGDTLQVAAEIAINQVNQMNALPGYRLRLNYNNSQCDAGVGTKILFEQLYTPPTKLAIIGGGCSSVSKLTAVTSHLYNLMQVSYGAVSPALSDKSVFPLFARVSTATDSLTAPRCQMFQQFGWKRIFILFHSSSSFIKAATDLRETMEQIVNGLVGSVPLSEDDVGSQIEQIKNEDYRIIVGLIPEYKAVEVMCEAYKRGLYGVKIVWHFVGWYGIHWWQNVNGTNCTSQQLAKAVEGYMSVGSMFYNDEDEVTVSGWRPSHFREVFNQAINNRQHRNQHYVYMVYDTVWAITLALNNTRQILLERGEGKGLEDFTYTDSDISNLLYSSLLNLTFMGVVGKMRFDKCGDAIVKIKIDRLQGGKLQTVGYYQQETGQLVWLKDTPIVWKGGVPPKDSRQIRKENVKLSWLVYGFICTLSSLGIILAVTFLVFNCYCRKNMVIRTTSPRANNVILAGCICANFSVFIADVLRDDTTGDCKLLQAKIVLFVLGTSVVFGVLFGKTWRVYTICFETRLGEKIKVISETQLFGFVGVLVMFHMGVLIAWWNVDNLHVNTRDGTCYFEYEGDERVKYCETMCMSTYELHFHAILYGTHGLILLFGCFLVYEIRSLHHAAMSDSKYIGMCMYNAVLMSLPGLVLDMALNPFQNIRYSTESSLIILGTTVTQCLIFVPKVKLIREQRIQAMSDKTLIVRPEPKQKRITGKSTLMSIQLPNDVERMEIAHSITESSYDEITVSTASN